MTNSHSNNLKQRTSWNRKDLDIVAIIRQYTVDLLSENEIAKLLKTSRNVIRTRLVEQGIPIRSSSEAEKIKWSRMTIAERINQTRKAHAATKGVRKSLEQQRHSALGRQRTGTRVGKGEDRVYEYLVKGGLNPQRQVALDGYNFDFLIDGIPVELNANSCDPLRRVTDSKKIKDIVGSRNMSIVYLCIKDVQHLRVEALQELVRVINILRKDPPPQGQYWMIRSYRNTYVGFTRNFHDRAFIQALEDVPKL